MQDNQFYTVGNENLTAEIRVKGSRFIAYIYHVNTQSDAKKRLEHISKIHHDASHNCYAFIIDPDNYRYSDDGEPSGTAGKPIFQILYKKKLQQVLLIVTRYFGGTKLGTGGLVRAYTDAAKAVLDKTKIVIRTIYHTISLSTDYDHMSEILSLINRYKGIIGKTDYTEYVLISAQIPVSQFKRFQEETNSLIDRGILHLPDRK